MLKRYRGGRLFPIFFIIGCIFLNLAVNSYSGRQQLYKFDDGTPVVATIPFITQPSDLVVDRQTAVGNYTASDQFNNGSITPWQDISQTGCSVTVESDVAGFARALKFTDTTISWRANGRRSAPGPFTNMWAEFWFYITDAQDDVFVQFLDTSGGVSSAEIGFGNGVLVAYNGSTIQTIWTGVPSNTWIHVRMEQDGITEKYNVTTDGILRGENIDFRFPTAIPNSINIGTALEDITTFYTAYWGYSWDPSYTAGDNFPHIEWNITDPDTTNPTYSVYKNGSTYLSNQNWTSGQAFDIFIGNLPYANTNMTIVASDGQGDSTSDMVIVSFPDQSPVLNSAPNDLLIDEQTARGNYTASDQFNTGFISPWLDISQAGCSLSVASNLAGFVRALKFTDTTPSWRVNGRRSAPGPLADMWAEFWFYTTNSQDTAHFQFLDTSGGSSSAEIEFGNGVLYAYNSSGMQTIWSGVPGNTWIHVRMEQDGTTHKYNVTINGVLRGDNVDFRDSTAIPNSINVASALEDVTSFYTAYWGYSWDPSYNAGDNFPPLIWEITDPDVNNPTFAIYKNNTFPYLTNKQWISGFPITFPLNDIADTESANFTIIADDGYGETVTDTVNVRIKANPRVTGPISFNYVYGTTGGVFNWTIIDVNTQDPTYTVYQNGSVWGSPGQPWVSGQNISINISSLAVGTYNFTIIADDGQGGIAADEVLVTIFASNSPITIEGPATFTYELGTISHVLCFNITDATTQDPRYTVYQNGSTWGTPDLQWESSVNVSVNIDNLPEGMYNFTIYAIDGLGLDQSHEVLVAVEIIDTNNVWQTIDVGVHPIVCKTSPTVFAELVLEGIASGAQIKIGAQTTNPVTTPLTGAVRFFSIVLDGVSMVKFPVTAHFYYDPTQLGSDTLESNLAVYHYEYGQWVVVSRNVNVDLNYIIVSCQSFSEYAIAPAPTEPNRPLDPGFYAFLIAIAAAILTAYGCFKFRKGKGKGDSTPVEFPELEFDL